MKSALTLGAALLAAVILSGCNGTFDDLTPKAEKPLPPKIVATLKAKGMARTSPIMVRIFKEEGKLEVWKRKDTGRYDIAASYDICKWSGKLGPKFTEGDRQAPEGFYTVRPAQMNPKSSYHLAFNIGFPNAYDRAHGRSGQHLMVHGACSSSGCYSMSDEQVEQIYAFARDAFRGGQTDFQIQAYPFRMTPENMARYKSDPNFRFWEMLKEGYDHFEITKVPPKVDVCDRRYVFNALPEGNQAFSPTSACPSTIQPESLQTAYQTYRTTYETAFTSALSSGKTSAPKPSIAGLAEAKLVAEWSKKRARGERVSREPPSLTPATAPDAAVVPSPGPRAETAPSSTIALAVPAPEAPSAEPGTLPAAAPLPAASARFGAVDEASAAAEPVSAAPAEAEQQIAPAAPAAKRRLWGLFGS